MGLRLESTLSLNSSEFTRGIAGARNSVTDFVKNAAVAAIGIGAISSAIHRTFETADELVNAADKMDMTVEQVQVLRKAAKDAGKEFEDMAGAIGKVNEARAKALGGDSKAKAAFTALGVSGGELRSKSGADILVGSIADKVKSTNADQIMLPLKEVLGKGGKEVVGVLKTDFKGLEADMKNAGAIMEDGLARQLDSIGDQFNTLGMIITSQLAPALLAFAKWAYEVINKGGGKVAKYSAGAGSLYSQTGGLGKFIGFVASTDWNLLKGKMGLSHDPQGAINARYGVNPKEIAARMGEAEQPWMKGLKDFQNRLADAANAGKRPKKDYSHVEALSSIGKARESSDSLIKVGNFLGASRGVIGNAQAMLAQHTAQTAINTKRTADELGKLVAVVSNRPAGSSASTESPMWAAN